MCVCVNISVNSASYVRECVCVCVCVRYKKGRRTSGPSRASVSAMCVRLRGLRHDRWQVAPVKIPFRRSVPHLPPPRVVERDRAARRTRTPHGPTAAPSPTATPHSPLETFSFQSLIFPAFHVFNDGRRPVCRRRRRRAVHSLTRS